MGLFGLVLSINPRFRLLLLYYSLFSVSVGFWTLSVSPGKTLIYQGSWRNIELTAFYVMPLGLAFYFYKLFGSGFSNVLLRVGQYYALLVPASFLSVVILGQTLESLLLVYQVSLLVSIILWMSTLIPTVRKNRDNLSVILGGCVMGITGVTDLLHAMGILSGTAQVVHFGVLAFFLALSSQLVVSILDFAQREALLRKIAAGTTGIGEDFFRALVKELAGAFSAKYAIVGELIDLNKQEVQTLAVWSGDRLTENFSYNLREIPSKQLSGPGSIRSHFGMPLVDKDLNPIGLVSVLHDRVLPQTGYAQTMLEIFASRAAAEIQRKQAEAQIRYLGHHDGLTGLPNRVLFSDRLTQAIAFAETHRYSFALLFLDVDNFKKINDSLGHQIGDLYLKKVAELINGCVSSIDTVSRRGGDEFIVLLPEQTHAEDAAQVARRICDTISQSVLIEETRIIATVSIGIAIYPRDGITADTLLKNSDIAMYHAKENGRNQFQYYSEDLNRITHERIEMDSALRDAIYLNQLEVYFQPQFNFRTGLAETCEALIRWTHPVWGKVPPEKFIPIAEESGQILEIGKWVLNEVAQRFADLDAAGLDGLRISVNVSARQLQSGDFCGSVESIIQQYNLNPRRIELEVTESMLMQDTQKSILAIKRLSDIGVKFSIDDFGTGYSSLSYLRQLKIHYLKIDRSFVRDVTDDPDDAAIVRAIISLAHSLRLSVIAEGVETTDQRDFLKAHGCDLMQGYLWAMPMPFDEVLNFLVQRRK